MEEFKPKKIFGKYYVHNFRGFESSLICVTLYQMSPYMSLLDMSKRKFIYRIK